MKEKLPVNMVKDKIPGLSFKQNIIVGQILNVLSALG
jgi:hypothetical protein